MEHEDDRNTNCNWCAQNNPQRIIKGTGRLENQRTSGDHPTYSIIEISQNTEKSPGDEVTCCHSNSRGKRSGNAGVKISQSCKIIIIIQHESDGDTNYDWCARNDPQRLGKGARRAGNRRTCRDHPN